MKRKELKRNEVNEKKNVETNCLMRQVPYMRRDALIWLVVKVWLFQG